MKKRAAALLLFLCLLCALCPPAMAAEDGIRIAVIDTGISTTAVDPARIAPGNNYIRPQDGTEDKLGHGTAVSAILVGSEKARIAGICPTASIVPLVYYSKNEQGLNVRGDTAMVAQMIYDAVDVYDCKIINISSGSSSDSDSLRDAVEYAESQGVLIVSCAGNNQKAKPNAPFYPGGYNSVLCVGAANTDGSIADFSQQNEAVDLLALGTDLRVASIRGTRIRGEGTSYSTAIVTGAAAQIWTNHPELTAAEVRSAVLTCTRTVGDWRVIDLEAAMNYAPTAEALSADEESIAANPSADVTEDAYYFDTVVCVAQYGVTGGVDKTHFASDAACTRA